MKIKSEKRKKRRTKESSRVDLDNYVKLKVITIAR